MTQAPEAPDAALAAARTALERHEWHTALELLTSADEGGELESEGLRLLASAAWWSGKFSDAMEYRERAFAAARLRFSKRSHSPPRTGISTMRQR